MSQLYLFETETKAAVDGSFTVRPRRLITGQEVGVKRVCGLLGFKDKEAIYRLIWSKQIKAWKPKSERGNGKWRIDLQSVLEYKERRVNFRD